METTLEVKTQNEIAGYITVNFKDFQVLSRVRDYLKDLKFPDGFRLFQLQYSFTDLIESSQEVYSNNWVGDIKANYNAFMNVVLADGQVYELTVKLKNLGVRYQFIFDDRIDKPVYDPDLCYDQHATTLSDASPVLTSDATLELVLEAIDSGVVDKIDLGAAHVGNMFVSGNDFTAEIF